MKDSQVEGQMEGTAGGCGGVPGEGGRGAPPPHLPRPAPGFTRTTPGISRNTPY